MNSTATVLRPRHGILLNAPPLTSERLIRRRVYLTWFLLYFNTLTFFPGVSFIHIPSSIGKGIAQATLAFALLCALSLNRRLLLRPNILLFLVTLIVLGTILTTLQPQHFGTVFRTFRFAGFVVTLWLLTPWWGRRDLLLLRCHLMALSIVLGSVLVGLVVSPGHALTEGRLAGALWPMQPTQVAHYAAVMIGVVVVLWFCGNVRGRTAAIVAAVAGIELILSHTRTALIALTRRRTGRRHEPDRGQATRPQALCHCRRSRRGRGAYVVGFHHNLAGAGPNEPGPGQPHRPHQGLGSPPRRSP